MLWGKDADLKLNFPLSDYLDADGNVIEDRGITAAVQSFTAFPVDTASSPTAQCAPSVATPRAPGGISASTLQRPISATAGERSCPPPSAAAAGSAGSDDDSGGGSESEMLLVSDEKQVQLPAAAGKGFKARPENKQRHRTSKQGKTSNYVGVCWNDGDWGVRIQKGEVKVSLGSFAEEADAGAAFDKAALLLRGRTAKLNFPLANYLNEAGHLVEDQQIQARIVKRG